MLRLNSGIIIAVPIPRQDEAQASVVNKAIGQALREVSGKSLEGRDVTPFLLARVNELTHGHSLKSNIALVMNNAKVGSAIAVHLANLSANSANSADRSDFNNSPVVVGGSNQDIMGSPHSGSKLLTNTSNPGTLVRQWGGVARNIAECLGRLGAKPRLITAVGDDATGSALLENCRSVGICIVPGAVWRSSKYATSTYVAIFDEQGELHSTIADMSVCAELTSERVQKYLARTVSSRVATGCRKPQRDDDKPAMLVIDANLNPETVYALCQWGCDTDVPVWFEPVGVAKSVRCVPALQKGLPITFMSPSVNELFAISRALAPYVDQCADDELLHTVDVANSAHRRVLKLHANRIMRHANIRHLIVTLGAQGALLVSQAAQQEHQQEREFVYQYVRATKSSRVVNSSGAGDTLVGATVWALQRAHFSRRFFDSHSAGSADELSVVISALRIGMEAARMTVESSASVSPYLSSFPLRAVHMCDGAHL